MALAIADKLDTIAGIYATGQKPTGTRDPFGLRRAALGLLRISIERQLDLDLQRLIEQALAALPFAAPAEQCARGVRLRHRAPARVLRRRRRWLRGDTGDVRRRAGNATGLGAGFRCATAGAGQFLQLPDAASLAAANKRIANILRKATEPVGDTVDTELLIDPAEQVLAEQVDAMARAVEPRFAARDYTPALQQLAALRPAVDDFFDSVMVMADDAALRANRLALLKRMQGLFMHAADLSRLPG